MECRGRAHNRYQRVITIKTNIDHFSLISVSASDHLYAAEINAQQAFADDKGYFGFVTSDMYKISLDSQLGGCTDSDEVAVNTHYNDYLSDGNVDIAAENSTLNYNVEWRNLEDGKKANAMFRFGDTDTASFNDTATLTISEASN